MASNICLVYTLSQTSMQICNPSVCFSRCVLRYVGADSFRAFWLVELPTALADRFGYNILEILKINLTASAALAREPIPDDDPTRGLILYQRVQPYLYRMLRYALSCVGMAFSEQVSGELHERVDFGFTFTVSDVQDGPVRIKHMTVLDYAQARMLALQAHEQVKHTVPSFASHAPGSRAPDGGTGGASHDNRSTVVARSRKAQAAARAASRLFALSSNLYQSALEREPINIGIMQERAFSLMGQHEATNPLIAEQALVRQIRYMLMHPSSMEAVSPLLVPMANRLLVMWQQRRYVGCLCRCSDRSRWSVDFGIRTVSHAITCLGCSVLCSVLHEQSDLRSPVNPASTWRR